MVLFVNIQPQLDKQSAHSASQRKLVAFVKAMDVFSIEALASDLHPSAEGSNCRKLFHCEPDCLSSGSKTTTNEPRTWPTPALCHEQFRWKSIVEGHGLFVQK
jgi:hypothetical protein